jgi:predicted permease
MEAMCSPEISLVFTKIHAFISSKMEIFTIAALETSNSVCSLIIHFIFRSRIYEVERNSGSGSARLTPVSYTLLPRKGKLYVFILTSQLNFSFFTCLLKQQQQFNIYMSLHNRIKANFKVRKSKEANKTTVSIFILTELFEETLTFGISLESVGTFYNRIQYLVLNR